VPENGLFSTVRSVPLFNRASTGKRELSGEPPRLPGGSWNQTAPWRSWGSSARGPLADAVALRLVRSLGLNERDLIIEYDRSLTLLWWLWAQPVYVNLTEVDGVVVVRAGCTVLGFSQLGSARWYAEQHNQTTTLWSWYAEDHPDLPDAGLWRSFLKLQVSPGSVEDDLSFVVFALKDFAADMQLKHFHNVGEFLKASKDEALAPLPTITHPTHPLTELSDAERSSSVLEHRLAIADYGKSGVNGFAGTPSRVIHLFQSLGDQFSVTKRPSESRLTAIGTGVSFWASPLVIVMLRTDVENPAIGAGLLVHVAIPKKVMLEDLENLTREELHLVDRCSSIGAWSTDPLDLWEAALGLPSATESDTVPPNRAAHTAFYPSRYATVRPPALIVKDLIDRVTTSKT